MNTPICDFVRDYAQKSPLRLHMPGHKGYGQLGIEPLDITEIEGADSLYDAKSIIAESEENASALFGCQTLYSTEGCSQCIRAMLFLAVMWAKRQGKQPRIAAARNVHKTFISAAAMLELDVLWLCPEENASYLSCPITADGLEKALSQATPLPTAVYLTSPDYLGNMADIPALSAVCRRYGVLLLVDNAHGAYLRFLQPSRHPIDLGADLCCDSAHKTLPALTGSAYLHIARQDIAKEEAKQALALFGSTSPSYLILQSLDSVNAYLDHAYSQKLAEFLDTAAAWKARLQAHGYRLMEQEPLKLTIAAKPYGYTGAELSALLEKQNVFCEFSDPDYLVMMLTPEMEYTQLKQLEDILCAIPQKVPILQSPPRFAPPLQAMSIREAVFSIQEEIPAEAAAGRILAQSSVGCPPAVPIAVCGQRIDKKAIEAFLYYGIKTITVVK